MAERVDAVVVGAGVVGLAVGRALARRGREVLVLEADGAIGTGTSSRNSEVVHAGIYYPPGSLKARLCVAGRDALYAYCAQHGVPVQRCGKLVVATSTEQRADLTAIAERARAAGAGALTWLDAEDLHARQPAVAGVAALWSPRTGIIDSHALMLALQGDLEAHGGQVVLSTPVLGIAPGPQVRTADLAVDAAVVVNAAGHGAWALAQATWGLAPEAIPARHLARGHYFTYAGRHPFDSLVYPVPEPGGLGVHLTLDLAGQARFGPDVQWCREVDYHFDAGRQTAFVDAVRQWWPALEPERLQPGYVGVRPKVLGAGQGPGDFVLSGPAAHGVPGVVNLFGIESPGLTACLALAEQVTAMVECA